jgi:hypothetical protein
MTALAKFNAPKPKTKTVVATAIAHERDAVLKLR